MKTFKAYTYDVWGNEEDGYDVNDVFSTNEEYTINSDLTDSEIVSQLQELGCIKKDIDLNLINIDGDEQTMYFDYKGKPEFELRLIA